MKLAVRARTVRGFAMTASRARKLLAAGLIAALSPAPAFAQEQKELIDYPGFAQLVGEVDAWRAQRMVDLKTFLRYVEDDNTIILDSRSADAFGAGRRRSQSAVFQI